MTGQSPALTFPKKPRRSLCKCRLVELIEVLLVLIDSSCCNLLKSSGHKTRGRSKIVREWLHWPWFRIPFEVETETIARLLGVLNVVNIGSLNRYSIMNSKARALVREYHQLFFCLFLLEYDLFIMLCFCCTPKWISNTHTHITSTFQDIFL